MSAPAMRAVDDLVVLVPVKPFACAKQRLAPVLSADQRAALAGAMLADVLAALSVTAGLAALVVVTADREAAALAGEFGARIFEEHPVDGLNAAVTHAAARLAGEGRRGLLVLPSDIPAVTPNDIARLIAAHPPGSAVSLVPAHDGRGTNALLVSPPGALAFAYGEGSFTAHRARAERAGLSLRVHDAATFPGMAEDVDMPADLAGLVRHAPMTRAARLIAASLRPRASA